MRSRVSKQNSQKFRRISKENAGEIFNINMFYLFYFTHSVPFRFVQKICHISINFHVIYICEFTFISYLRDSHTNKKLQKLHAKNQCKCSYFIWSIQQLGSFYICEKL